MLPALLLAALAALAPGTDRAALEVCLVHLANTPEYAAQTVEELAVDRAFLAAAVERWCAEEASALRPDAEIEARRVLGAGPEGPELPLQRELAQSELARAVGERLLAAAAMRASPPALPHAKMEELQLLWQQGEIEDPAVMARLEPTVSCAARAIRQGRQPAATFISGTAVPVARLGPIAGSCGYDLALDYLAERALARFPSFDGARARRAADSLVGQLLFWALLSPAQSPGQGR
jgi:hypothetical protein